MIIFWVFAVAMVIIALIFLLRPLMLELSKNDIDRSAQNVAITKERLNELKIEFEQETITAEEYENSKEELELALLNDIEESTVKSKSSDNTSFTRLARYSLIICIPFLAIGFYFQLGAPELIDGGNKSTAASSGQGTKSNSKVASVEEMVEKLAKRMKEKPDNAEGWFMLARSYMSMGRYKEAAEALEKTNKLVPNNPVVMLRYADALTMLSGGRLSGKPFELIKKAVALKPNDPTGLWLIGMAYEEQGQYKKAISYWEILLPILTDNKSIDEVSNLIRAAKKKAGISLSKTSPTVSTNKNTVATSLKVSVSINKNMLKHVSKEDVVFIFAKAVSGPPMPLAVVRKQVKDLPLQVTLDDSMAMIPNMTLSSFDKVKIIARVSKSGKPSEQKGDVVSKENIVSLPNNNLVTLVIDSVKQ